MVVKSNCNDRQLAGMRVQLCSQNNENTEVNAREVRFSETKCTFQELAIWIRGENGLFNKPY